MRSSDEPSLILIDGRSGSGKTTLAIRIAKSKQAYLISLDDIYPGWDGLDAGSWHLYEHGLLPRGQGVAGRYQLWDWKKNQHGAWLEIPVGRPVVVEGCGSIRNNAPVLGAHCIWLDLDESLRRRRAAERDGPGFKKNWERWARQEERFQAVHRSRDLADEVRQLG